MASTLETLKAARKLIEKPENWTKHVLARDRKGKEVDFSSPDAVCWCSSGSIQLANPNYIDASEALASVCKTTIPYFNDSHTHAEVLAAFDAAIAKEQA